MDYLREEKLLVEMMGWGVPALYELRRKSSNQITGLGANDGNRIREPSHYRGQTTSTLDLMILREREPDWSIRSLGYSYLSNPAFCPTQRCTGTFSSPLSPILGRQPSGKAFTPPSQGGMMDHVWCRLCQPGGSRPRAIASV